MGVCGCVGVWGYVGPLRNLAIVVSTLSCFMAGYTAANHKFLMMTISAVMVFLIWTYVLKLPSNIIIKCFIIYN